MDLISKPTRTANAISIYFIFAFCYLPYEKAIRANRGDRNLQRGAYSLAIGHSTSLWLSQIESVKVLLRPLSHLQLLSMDLIMQLQRAVLQDLH